MTPEERAGQLVTAERGIEAIRAGDTFALERLIAEAIREAVTVEREWCAGVALLVSQEKSDMVAPGYPEYGYASRVAGEIAARIREGKP